MDRTELVQHIHRKQSFLCVGLDPDPARIPDVCGTGIDGVVHFCKEIISHTRDYCVAYKPNIAFFEALGRRGWEALFRVREALPDDCFLIADAKRADIGNSSRMYARAFFEELDFDAITVAPYMGADSVMPFLEYPGKWTILLALTSNSGSQDFQVVTDPEGIPLYQRMIARSGAWGSPEQLMYVVGATHPDLLRGVREVAGDYFFLVPGVGAQGGDLRSVAEAAMTDDVGLLVNATRAIIYAGDGMDFAEQARLKAHAYQAEMAGFLSR
ncbi:MAG: orotidine-5'-phosphate decarboxylase [Saprospiraceae bacterium]|nr:orotidine-5'-phosphate decarboxylase [Saprospiraceae bacterium]